MSKLGRGKKFFQIKNKTRNLKVFKLRYYVINQQDTELQSTNYRSSIKRHLDSHD